MRLLAAVDRTAIAARTWIGLHRLLIFDFRGHENLFIITYPRSGTTWVQMIVYLLLSGGTTSFDHITQVCPFLEVLMNQPGVLPRQPRGRVFKTHLRYRQVRKFRGKYIYVVRDGRDVLISCYHFYRRWNAVPFEVFFEQFMRGQLESGSWFEHVSDALSFRRDDRLLLVAYEDLQSNLRETVRRIASFCDIDVTDEQLDAVLPKCTFAYMKEHEHKFDPLNRDPTEPFIRAGRVGEWRDTLTVRQRQQFETETKRHFRDGNPYAHADDGMGVGAVSETR
jgi:sulfotransferase family protein